MVVECRGRGIVSSQFRATHGSMFVTDRDGALAQVIWGELCVSLLVMACAPANVCETASWIWGHSEDSGIIIGD